MSVKVPSARKCRGVRASAATHTQARTQRRIIMGRARDITPNIVGEHFCLRELRHTKGNGGYSAVYVCV